MFPGWTELGCSSGCSLFSSTLLWMSSPRPMQCRPLQQLVRQSAPFLDRTGHGAGLPSFRLTCSLVNITENYHCHKYCRSLPWLVDSNTFLERHICYDNEKILTCLKHEGTQLVDVLRKTVTSMSFKFLAKLYSFESYSRNKKFKNLFQIS